MIKLKISEKVVNIIFLIISLIIISIPLIFIRKTIGREDLLGENRKLTIMPQFIIENNEINKQYLQELEKWFNDNFGFRELIIEKYAKFQYDIFDKIIAEDYYLGQDGSLIYATKEIIFDYQHLNLKSNIKTENIAKA